MDDRAPAWARGIATLLPACSQFFISGNIHDRFVIAPQSLPGTEDWDESEALGVHEIVRTILRARGVNVVIGHDITSGACIEQVTDERARDLTHQLGFDPAALAPRDHLAGLADLVERVVATRHESVALIVSSASRLTRDLASLSDEEFAFWRRVDRVLREAESPVAHSDGRELYNTIVWILDSERDVPPWYSLSNALLRSLVIPMPDSGERQRYAERLVLRLKGDEAAHRGAVRVLTEQSAGMSLVAMDRAIAIANDQRLGPDRVEDAVRSYRVGVTENPWRSDYIVQRLRDELDAHDSAASSDGAARSTSGSMLAGRVLGQERSVRKVLDLLVRSATGLTAAQAGPTATRPRGVLFLAGPTGVGKTELAKALTKLLFDDERFYIRFDMSEFSAEQAADRLIGAPPGYVGYTAGGELTNAIRQRPFSVVLFDEIEKAHPRILDKFLQLLDDGRLTDGRGETVYFTEAVVVFTSNLGIYVDDEHTDASGNVVRQRRLVVKRGEVDYEQMSKRVSDEIKDHFTRRLGRPELLNRLGDNIVVFDFIDRPTGVLILDRMLDNVVARVRTEHGIELSIAPDVRDAIRDRCLDDETLDLGGRGIGSKLETALIDPLAHALFRLESPVRTAALRVTDGGGSWKVALWPT